MTAGRLAAAFLWVLPLLHAQSKPVTVLQLTNEADAIVVGTVKGPLNPAKADEWRFLVEERLSGHLAAATEILVPAVAGEVAWGTGSKLLLFLKRSRTPPQDLDARARYQIVGGGGGAFRLRGEIVQTARGASPSLVSSAKLGSARLIDYVGALIEARK